VLQLATEYPTPIRKGNKNGTTTVSVEITDIYEKYGSQLYVQIDDYAVNSCLYQLNVNEANANVLPKGEDFAIAEEDESVTLDIYGSQKINLVYGESYQGNADKANFLWTSANPKIADVKNGEIVGLSAGTTKIFVSNRKGATKTIEVTVRETQSSSLAKVPFISFGLVQTNTDALVKASGPVKVNAGKQFKLSIEKDPWYHPMSDLQLKWTSSNPAVATVDSEGNVLTLKKGTAVISAVVLQQNASGKWEETLYSATVILQVQNEFTVSSYILNDYNGVGGTVVIPTDMNIWYIGEEAFKDNNNIKKIIIPSSVVEIRARAFYNCTALEEVYFVSEEKQPIADADLSMIFEHAFYGCTNLKKVDFSNVKTITVAADSFGNCPNLKEVVDMPSIGTMHHRAFAGTALTSVDLTGLHMSGESVFEGCQALTEIKTGKFTAIGKNMFRNCLGLRNTVTLATPKIGEGAFSGCKNLAGVKFVSPLGESLEFEIGARAFENCGRNIRGNFIADFGGENIRVIGERAFAGSSLKNLQEINGLEVLGSNAFANTQLTTVWLDDNVDIEKLRLAGVPFEGLTLTVVGGSGKYTEENGVIYNADKSKIIYVNASVEGEFSLPASVTAIGDYAFTASKASKVILSSALTKIGVGAFKGSALQSLDWGGAAVTAIPDSAFENSNLTAIVLPETITEIGANAFKNSALASFQADGLQKVGDSAFEGCIAMESITLADTVKEMGVGVFTGCIALREATLLSVEKLGAYTFYNAKNLQKVILGDGVLTTGKYTFAETPIQEVTLGNAITCIEEGAFYGCNRLESIDLSGVDRVEAYAFSGCNKLTAVGGLAEVEYFGEQAFYNTALPALSLDSAKYIEAFAFADGEYESISLPIAESVGDFAFMGAKAQTVTLPATLTEMGVGVFADAKSLSEITVENGNPRFFAEAGVLYRYTDEQGSEFALVCYPSARMAKEGAYEIKEGTVRILAYAFYGLQKQAVSSVVLPYSVNSIGDSAFYNSGIKAYTFESIQAPVLETEYRAEITQLIEAQSTIAYYKGYYYTNFEKELYYFTKYGKQESPLAMYYPSNGKGYDNHVYSLYFGVKTSSESDLITDDTRACVQLVESMPDSLEISSWADLAKTEENKAMVEEFASALKTARVYYNNAKADEGQAVYITAETEAKLLSAEQALRSVKAAFGIPLIVKELRVADNSSHKSSYLIGEEFDMEGLALTLVYDDYSTADADFSKIELITKGKLSEYNKYVEVRYNGVKARIPVSVTNGEVTPPPVEDDSSVEDSVEDSVLESGTENGQAVKIQPFTLLILGCGLGVILVIVLVIGAFSARAQKKKDEEAKKEKALKEFAEKYGEIRVNVVGLVHEDGKNGNGGAHLNSVVNQLTAATVEIPEGGAVSANVKMQEK